MTTPPFDPVGPVPEPSDDRTEPVPTLQPAFQPVAPEPAPGPAPVPAEPVRRGSSGSSRLLNLALGLAVVVATAGIAFAVGRATAPATVATAGISGRIGAGVGPGASFDPSGNDRDPGGLPGSADQPGGSGGRGTGGRGLGGFGGGLTITGTVDSMSAESITIKTESGQTVTVGLDGSTTYHQQADAAASDVTPGTTVQLQITGGFRPGQNSASGASVPLGTAGSVTIVP